MERTERIIRTKVPVARRRAKAALPELGEAQLFSQIFDLPYRNDS